MKKNELYRSIDSIKQDKSLKNRVMNAVETKDRIVVHKRPFFIPAAAAVLLAVNIAFVGSLITKRRNAGRVTIWTALSRRICPLRKIQDLMIMQIWYIKK